MATVAELEVVLDFKDKGVKVGLKEIDASVKALDGKSVDIEVAPIEPQPLEELKVIDQMIDEIDGRIADAEVSIDANVDDVTQAFALVEEEIARLEKETAEVKAEADVADVVAQLDMVDSMLAKLDRQSAEVGVDVDVAGSIAKLEMLRMELKRVEEAAKEVNDTDVTDLDRAFQKLSVAAQRTSVNISGMTAAILSVGPALVPIAAVGAAGIGAVSAAALGAGAAIGAFALASVNALGPVKDALDKITTAQDAYNIAVTDKQKEAALLKIQAIMKSLEPGQLAVVQGVLALQKSWNDLNASIRPEVYQMAAEALGAISRAMPALQPLIMSSVKAFHELQTASLAALGSPVWQTFFDNISSSAGPAIESLGRSLGNLATGLIGIFNAFFPYQGTFLQGLESITAAFARWGASLGASPQFQAFISYVGANAPAIGQMLIAVAKAFTAIVIEAAPLGISVVKNVTALADAITKLHASSPGTLTASLAIAGLGAVAVNVAGPILALVNLIKNLWTWGSALSEVFTAMETTISVSAIAPFVAWGAAIAAVVAAVTLAYNNLSGFREAVNQLGATFMTALQPVLNFAQQGIAAVGKFFGDMINVVTTWAGQHTALFSSAWNGAKTAMDTVLTGLTNSVTSFLNIVKSGFSLVWEGIKNYLGGVWEAIKGVIQGAIDVILGIITVFLGVITGNWSEAWEGLKLIATGVWRAITGVVSGAIQSMLGLIQAAIGMFAGVFRLLWEGLEVIAKAAWTTIKAIVPDGLKSMMSAIESWYARFKAAGLKLMSSIGEGIKSGVNDAVNSVKGAVDKMAAYLPGSPAEIGPLSGHGYVKLRGQRFIEDLSIGLADTSSVEDRVSAIASMLAVSPSVSGFGSASVASAYGSSSGSVSPVYVTVAAGAVSVDARGSSDAAAVSSAAQTATASLATQLRLALEKR